MKASPSHFLPSKHSFSCRITIKGLKINVLILFILCFKYYMVLFTFFNFQHLHDTLFRMWAINMNNTVTLYADKAIHKMPFIYIFFCLKSAYCQSVTSTLKHRKDEIKSSHERTHSRYPSAYYPTACLFLPEMDSLFLWLSYIIHPHLQTAVVLHSCFLGSESRPGLFQTAQYHTNQQ